MADDIFDAMIEEFSERGWGRRDTGSNDGSKCLLGCLVFVQYGDVCGGNFDSISREMSVLARAICLESNLSTNLADLDIILQFNDFQAASIEDIFRVLNKAKEVDA